MENELKLKQLNTLLAGQFVLLHLRINTPGLVIPEHLTKQTNLTLQVSKLFKGAMEINDHGIVCDLLFNQQYFTCRIPFEAIWGASSDQGKTYLFEAQKSENTTEKATTGRPSLKRVK